MPFSGDYPDSSAGSNPELKPCPFCGGEPKFSRDGEYHVLRCASCRAEHADEIKRKAVERWNTRTPVAVKPLVWDNLGIQLGYPDEATDVMGGVWRRWTINGERYFKAPSETCGQLGCADEEYARRILSALIGGEA